MISASRFEIKYAVAPSQRVALMSDVAVLMQRDPHVPIGSAGYHISSLYFDTGSFSAYRDKLAGILRRKKYRIRTYRENPDHLFFEIKERFSNRILKRRTRIDMDCYRSILQNDIDATLPAGAVMREFACDCALGQQEPVAIIEYDRLPFAGVAHGDLRITFDSNIRVCRSRSLFNSGAWFNVSAPGLCVLEIKFNSKMPHWIHDLVRKYGLRDMAYSKYCLGIETLSRVGVL